MGKNETKDRRDEKKEGGKKGFITFFFFYKIEHLIYDYWKKNILRGDRRREVRDGRDKVTNEEKRNNGERESILIIPTL